MSEVRSRLQFIPDSVECKRPWSRKKNQDKFITFVGAGLAIKLANSQFLM
jgi:hypothetical protein